MHNPLFSSNKTLFNSKIILNSYRRLFKISIQYYENVCPVLGLYFYNIVEPLEKNISINQKDTDCFNKSISKEFQHQMYHRWFSLRNSFNC